MSYDTGVADGCAPMEDYREQVIRDQAARIATLEREVKIYTHLHANVQGIIAGYEMGALGPMGALERIIELADRSVDALRGESSDSTRESANGGLR